MRSIVFLVVAFLPMGCYNDKEMILYPETNCTTTQIVTYQANIVPILNQYCNSCHSGSFPSGGILLDTYAHLKTYVDNGRLMGSIQWSSGYSPMPKNAGKLSTCSISSVQAWITAGAQNN